MQRLTIVVAVALILLGIISYAGVALGGDSPHWTALIPAFPGAALLLLGLLAGAFPAQRKHIMHVAMLIGVLVLAAGLGQGISGITGDPGAGAIVSLIMAAIALVFVIFGVRSFINARRGDNAKG